MNTKLLKAEIAAKEMSYREVAQKANISRSAFSAKINGQRSFDTEEVVRLCDVLEIEDNSKKVAIFLS